MSPSRRTAPSAVVGLDIGSDSIKVAEAKYTKDGITITGMGIAPTPQGAIENEVIVDPKAPGRRDKGSACRERHQDQELGQLCRGTVSSGSSSDRSSQDEPPGTG